ncbi:hypothetical protein TNCV_3677761 [Trichonephila clavipes]|nr:hypothetical protein TNCV_3677761 [Trichonephila clavipes]
MQVKSVEVQCPPVDVMQKLTKGGVSSDFVLVTWPKPKITKSVTGTPCVAVQCDFFTSPRMARSQLRCLKVSSNRL